MSGNGRAFLKPADIPPTSDLDVFLFGPFWPFANGRRGPVELVMMTLDRAALDGWFTSPGASVAGIQQEISRAIVASGRPLSLKMCGEGWIRIEQQLGKDLTAWPGHPVRLFRARKVLAGRRAVDYIGVRAMNSAQRIVAFGGLA